MRKKGNSCICMCRFLSILRCKPDILSREDELFTVKRFSDEVAAYSYRVSNDGKHKIEDCIIKLW